MLETFNELLIVCDAITDEERVVYLLASLPESFNTLVTALESNSTVPEMETVIKRLMHEERKLKDRQVSSESGSVGALAARHKTQSKGPKCYGCLRFEHIPRNCPECTRSTSSIFLPIFSFANLCQVMLLITLILSPLPSLFSLICFTKLIWPFCSLSVWNSLSYHVKSSSALITFKSKVNMLLY